MKQRMKKFIEAVIFLLLVLAVFVHCTYLFRNTDRAARQNILGLYYEEKNSLDVVFVGPSSVYRYWSPMKAWELYGFTSYDFSVSSMSRAAVLTAIRDLRRSQSPKVIVVDVRPFINAEEVVEIGHHERNVFDSIDQSLCRLQGVKYLSDHSAISGLEIGSEYMELAQYHNNKAALAEELNWQLIDNRLNSSPDGEGFYKGFAIAAKHTYQVREMACLTDKAVNEVSEYYMDILEYGRKNGLTFLFVASPLIVSERQSEAINGMRAAAEKYGYKFVDGNRFYDEIELDFTTDFYNRSHVNILGAEKWTEFLADYLVKNYELQDCRDNIKYNSWERIYEQYKEEAEAAVNETRAVIQNHDASLEREEIMRETEDFTLWFKLANDNNISILVSVDSCREYAAVAENLDTLKWFGINAACMAEDEQYYALYCNRTIQDHTFKTRLEGIIGGMELPFTIYKNHKTKLVIEENEWEIPQDGIYFFAYDNNLHQAVDFVKLQFGETGSVELRHLEFE